MHKPTYLIEVKSMIDNQWATWMQVSYLAMAKDIANRIEGECYATRRTSAGVEIYRADFVRVTQISA